MAVRRGLSLDDLRSRRNDILRIARAHGAQNVRIFGSVARGEADARDLDVLVDVTADMRGFAYFEMLEDLRHALAAELGCEVDVVDSAALHGMRERVPRDAVPI